jgi:hypothetical protein
MSFGPWHPDIDAPERLARLRSMRALAGVFCHHHPQFAEALRAAETDQAELERALQLLDELPALNRRRLLASYGAMTKTAASQA